MAFAAGVGQLVANDILSDISFMLVEPPVFAAFPVAVAPGLQILELSILGMYVGAQLLAGVRGGDQELITVTAVTAVSFSAVFVNAHAAGEPIVGAIFPVQQTAGDPFFTQAEMLDYLATAMNDFLTQVPLAYNVASIPFAATQIIAALPADCMKPERVVAFGRGLRETSQSYLDANNYRWQQTPPSEPYTYYRDKIGVQNFALWPTSANMTTVEIVYQQRSSQTLSLGDGLILPDVFMPTIKAKVMVYALSKDGEASSPALAKVWQQKFDNGLKAAGALMEVIQDQGDQ